MQNTLNPTSRRWKKPRPEKPCPLFDAFEQPAAVATIELPPASSSATKRSAAEAIRPHTSKLAREVLRVIRSHGDYGATAHEIVRESGLLMSTCSARCHELERKFLIRDSGRTRLSPSRRPAKVWIAREASS